MKSPHETVVHISSKVNQFFQSVFTEVHIEGPRLDAAEIQRHPLMVVSTHRSHIDYFLNGYILYTLGFKHMRFAAGDNLTRLPYIGPRFRALGAFTVSRDVGFERNYVKNLCNSVIGMMEKREAVIVFPEGGRSYSGSMLEIKNGLLGASILLQAREPQEDVILLPMAISYECPPDVPYFNLLLKGKKFRKRNNSLPMRLLGSILYFGADILAFGKFMMAPRTGKKYGAAYLDYAEPVSVKSLLDVVANRAEGVKDEFFSHRGSMQQLGEIVHKKFLTLFRLLPMHFVAAVLSGQKPMAPSALEMRLQPLLDKCKSAGRNLKSVEELSLSQIVQKGTQQLQTLGAVQVKSGLIEIRRLPIVEYMAAAVQDGSTEGDDDE